MEQEEYDRELYEGQKAKGRTKVCKFFLTGNCSSGEACTYLHEDNEYKNPQPQQWGNDKKTSWKEKGQKQDWNHFDDEESYYKGGGYHQKE